MAGLKKNKSYSGFSLMELLVAISIFTMALMLGLPAFRNLQASVGLENAGQEFVNALRQAQQRSISSSGMMAHGVHIGQQAYTVFGANWPNPNYSEEHRLPPGLEFSQGSGLDIIFDRHSGYASPALLGLKAGESSLIIRISSTGTIEME